MSCSLIIFQMMRVISSPSSSTTLPSTLILDILATLRGQGPPQIAMSAVRALQRRVQRLARPHHRRGLIAVRVVVAADVYRITLHLSEFGDDSLFLFGQRLGQFGEVLGQLLVFGLLGEFLRPVQRKVELTAAVVELTGLARRALVVLQQLAYGAIQGLAKQRGSLVAGLDSQVLEASAQSEEFAERIPPQVVLFDQLVHMLRR